MPTSIKTQTDLMLENYLQQEQIPFQYEPFGDREQGTRSPDYMFEKVGKKILVENKELEQTLLDKVIPNTAQSLNLQGGLNLLRRRVDSASKQLKPYQKKVDYCVVLLGKKQGFPIGITDLFWALYGNPVIRVPIDTITGRPLRKGYTDLTAMGALRKNHPDTGEMIYVHDYISGVGLITSFNASLYYETTVMDPIMSDFASKQRNLPLEQQMKAFLKYYTKVWGEKKKHIPDRYSNPNKTYYKIEIIANPLSRNPLPNNIFNAEWDVYKLPEIMSE